MSFLMGKHGEQSNVNEQTGALHNQLLQYLGFTGIGQGLNPSVTPDAASMQPFLTLFTQQNQRNLAQAKESAGNLTGSGLGTVIGQEAGRANAEQGAFLANLFEQRRRQEADRFASVLLGALNSQAGGMTPTYTPGLLDYAGQGAQALASGGAFNGLFSAGGAGAGAAGSKKG